MSVTPFTLALAGCLLVNWMLCVTYRTLHSCRNRVVLHIPFRTNEIMLAHSFLCSFSLYRIFSDFLKSNFSFVFLLLLSRSLLLIFFVFFSPSLSFFSYPSVTVLYLFLLLPPAFLHSVCSHSTISVPWLFVYILFIVQHEHQQKKKLDIFRFPWHSCGLHGKVTLHVNIFRSNWNEPNKYVYKVTFGKCTIVFCTWGFVDFIPFFLSFSHFFSCAPLFAHFLFCSYPVSPVPENESQI